MLSIIDNVIKSRTSGYCSWADVGLGLGSRLERVEPSAILRVGGR